MNKVVKEKKNFSPISDTVIIFKMNKELNENENISEIQDTYFEQFLKVDGRYLVPGNKKKPAYAENSINDNDTIIFIYQDMLIATSKIKKDATGKYCFKVTEEEKRNWPYEVSKEEWQIFKYYFCFQDVKKLPPIYFKRIEELFTEPLPSKCRAPIFLKTLKEDTKEKFINLIHFENQKSLNFDLIYEKTWQNLIKNVKKPSLLKEINLYSYENIHTSFLCNFLSLDNIYGLKDEPLKNFIKYLQTQAQGKNQKRLAKINLPKAKIEVKSQYHFNREQKIIPDITISFDDKIYLIIEAKVCAFQNIYNDEQKQCDIYYDNLEKDPHKEFIYVFLTMRQHNEKENSQHMNEYIKITFKDIYENLYKKYLDIKVGGEILHEYLKSFHYLCDNEKYNFTIEEIPAYYLIAQEKLEKQYEKLKEDIEKIANYKIPANIAKEDLLYYRYLLVLLYNREKNKKTKEKLKICYDNLVGYK